MKAFLHFVFFLFGIVFTTAHAQRICGTTEYKQNMLKSDPNLEEVFKQVEKQIAANGRIARRDTSANEMIYIPVVIHILYKNPGENISDAQIKSQIDVLNNDFNLSNSDQLNTPMAFKSLAGNARIQFCLARVDPQGKKTSGIDRKYTSQDLFSNDDEMKMADKGGIAAWDSKRYLNIWVCKLSTRNLGYATSPGSPGDKDGIVMAYDVFGTIGNLRAGFNKGRTATHEVGHWLGLIHIWGDTNCGNDQVDDTPAQQTYNYGCQSFPKISNCSPNSNGDMFMNFMDFTDDACMNIFTKGQVKRMRALFAQNNMRNSFLASTACDSTLAKAGPLPITNTILLASSSSLSFQSIKVFPSIVHTAATIECSTATANTIKTMTIFNSLGIQVFTARLKQQRTELNLSNLIAGVYIIQISDGKEKLITRISKQ